MKNYQIYGFSYINSKKGTNLLNGTSGATWEEDYYEYQVACFNGLAYFKSCCGYYVMDYPRIQNLTESQKRKIERHVGYVPGGGEYGAICSALGVPRKVSAKQFKEICRDYPIKASDEIYFEWLNGGFKTRY